MPNRAVVFVSEAHSGLSQTRLATIMADAERFNRNAGVSGITLFDGRRFLSYMEGPPDGLDVAFSRAIGATSHSGVIEIARGRVGQRRLPYWPMRWLPVQPDELKALALADWTSFTQRGGRDGTPLTAMDLLVAYVEPYAIAA